MTSNREQVNQTYGSPGLARRLIESLATAGLDPQLLTTEDLITFDELHVMGRDATLALGRLANLHKEMRVLDMGSGLGGAARTLAQTFGCHVTGVDLMDEFVGAAQELSHRVGLDHKVAFQQADVLDLPFESHRFDAAFMFHLGMNIEKKTSLYQEARRVLKADGLLLLWEICTGLREPLIYPVPWAANDRFSHLVPISTLLNHLSAAGFEVRFAEDATSEAQAWVKARVAAMGKSRSRRPTPDLNLVLENFRLKRANVSKNLMENTITLLRAFGTQASGPHIS